MPPAVPSVPILGTASNTPPLTAVIGSASASANPTFVSGQPFGPRSSQPGQPQTFGGAPSAVGQQAPSDPTGGGTFASRFSGVGQVPGVLDLPLLTPQLASPQDTLQFQQATGRPINQGTLRLAQLLGPQLGPILGDAFTRPQLPFIEARLNFANRLQQEGNRQVGLDLLGEQRSLIGQSPESLAAREVALERLMNPDPIDPTQLNLQQSEIRQRGAIGLEDAQRSLSQSLARQGLGGSASSFQQAQLEQAAARQVSSELQRLAIDNALQRDVNEAEAIDRVESLAGEDELRRVALGQSIVDLLTQPTGQFDLSSLAAGRVNSGGGLLTEIAKALG